MMADEGSMVGSSGIPLGDASHWQAWVYFSGTRAVELHFFKIQFRLKIGFRKIALRKENSELGCSGDNYKMIPIW